LITRSSIENLKHHIDLYQVIADYVSLQKSGSAWKGLSPFTQEKTPSFFVYPDKGFFYCFSTSQGGDAIKFLQIKENFSFMEAVEALADRFNFKLEYENRDGRPSPERAGGGIKRLKMIHEHACKYYSKAFKSELAEAQNVRSYWENERGFTLEDAEKHEIGYAPIDAKHFQEYLKKQGYSDEEFEASGLFFPRGNRSGSRMARFRGRLMIPIRDLTGNVIAFTGRKLPQTPQNDPAFEAKYVNSPKTDIFNKGSLLFGLHLARKVVSESTPFVMVEGQLDAIRCWIQGFEQVIATQGTAITDIQLGKLKNYCPQLIMCLDGDSAGTKAALRVLPMALSVGLEVHFIRLGEGDDPDTYLIREGREGFQRLLDSATPAVPFLVATYFDPENRAAAVLSRAAEQCFEIILRSPSKIVRDRMLEELASRAQLDIRLTKSDFQSFERKKGGRQTYSEIKAAATQTSTAGKGNLTTAESDLLRLAIQHASVRAKIQHFDFSEIIEPGGIEGQLLGRVCAELREDPNWSPERDCKNICDDEMQLNLIYRLLAEEVLEDEPDEKCLLCIKSMQLRHDNKRLKEIDQKLNREGKLSDEELNELLKEKVEIKNRVAKQ
jgi:DNA primase